MHIRHIKIKKGCLLVLLLVVVGTSSEEDKCGTKEACKENWFCDRTRIDRPVCLQCKDFLKYCFSEMMSSKCLALCKRNLEQEVESRVRLEEKLICKINLTNELEKSKNQTSDEIRVYQEDIQKLKESKSKYLKESETLSKDEVMYLAAIAVLVFICLVSVFLNVLQKLRVPKPDEVKDNPQVPYGVQVRDVQDNEPPRSCNEQDLFLENEQLGHQDRNPV